MNTAGFVFAKYRQHDDTTCSHRQSHQHRSSVAAVSNAGEDDVPSTSPEQGLLQASSLPDISVSGEVTAVSLAKQLFGERDIEKASFWDEIVTRTWQELTRSGLVTDQRDLLLKKYSPPD